MIDREILYTKCPVCGDGTIERHKCMICEGHGFIESGLNTRQIDLLKNKLARMESKNQELIQLVTQSDKAAEYLKTVQSVGGCPHCGGTMYYGQNIVYCTQCGGDGNPTKLKY